MGEIFSRPDQKLQAQASTISPTNPAKVLAPDMAVAYQQCLKNADKALQYARGHPGYHMFDFSCTFPPAKEPDVEGKQQPDTDAIAFQSVMVTAYHNLTGKNGHIRHYTDKSGLWRVCTGRFDSNVWMLETWLKAEDIPIYANAYSFKVWQQSRDKLVWPRIEEDPRVAPRVLQTWGRPPQIEAAAVPTTAGEVATAGPR